MTNLDEWKAILTKFDIPFSITPDDGMPDDGLTRLTVEAESENGVVVGYPGFLTSIEFDAQGKFLRFGIWE